MPADAATGEAGRETTLDTFARFRDHDWIVNSRNTADEEVIRTLASMAGFRPRVTHQADSLDLVQEMIGAGLGVACCRCSGCGAAFLCGDPPWPGPLATARTVLDRLTTRKGPLGSLIGRIPTRIAAGCHSSGGSDDLPRILHLLAEDVLADLPGSDGRGG